MGERETDALCLMELNDPKPRGRVAHYGRLAGGRYFSVENRSVNPWRFCAPPLSCVPIALTNIKRGLLMISMPV